jgi:hypothetical protein
MAVYQVSVRTPAAAAGATYADLRSTSTDRLRVRELHIFSLSATETFVGLIRPASVGTASTTVAGQARDPAEPAATGLVGSAWSAAPTIAGSPIYLARYHLPATIASGLILTYPIEAPLVIAVSSSLLLWNFGGSAGSALDVTFVWEE